MVKTPLTLTQGGADVMSRELAGKVGLPTPRAVGDIDSGILAHSEAVWRASGAMLGRRASPGSDVETSVFKSGNQTVARSIVTGRLPQGVSRVTVVTTVFEGRVTGNDVSGSYTPNRGVGNTRMMPGIKRGVAQSPVKFGNQVKGSLDKLFALSGAKTVPKTRGKAK